MKLFNKFSSAKEEQTSELPFFYFVSLAMLLIGIWSIYSTPRLQETGRLVSFSVLMITHIALYWLVLGLSKDSPFTILYLAVQGILALAINLLAENIALPMGLYMGLIGLAVGMYGLSRTGILIISTYLFLSMLSFSRVVGWSATIWWLFGAIPVMVFVILYVTLYNRQTEARAQAQRLASDLEDANHRLSEYATRVEALTLTGERQRMARELHDTLSQGLAGLILQLEAADAHLSANRPERAHTIVQQTMIHARETLTSARRAIDDLRQQNPSDPREAIQQEVDHFTKVTGIPCRLTMDLEAPIPDALCEPAQRAISEALTNIARHAQAGSVQVSVRSSASHGLEITVQDDGQGFDSQSAVGKPGHYGLLGLRERSRLAGGIFEIQSSPGQGTSLKLHLPYQFSTSDQNEPQQSVS